MDAYPGCKQAPSMTSSDFITLKLSVKIVNVLLLNIHVHTPFDYNTMHTIIIYICIQSFKYVIQYNSAFKQNVRREIRPTLNYIKASKARCKRGCKIHFDLNQS